MARFLLVFGLIICGAEAIGQTVALGDFAPGPIPVQRLEGVEVSGKVARRERWAGCQGGGTRYVLDGDTVVTVTTSPPRLMPFTTLLPALTRVAGVQATPYSGAPGAW